MTVLTVEAAEAVEAAAEAEAEAAMRVATEVTTLMVPAAVLDAARRQLEDAGVEGVEATGLMVAGPDRVARRVVFPDQEAGRAPGHWVQVTDQGKRELALALAPDELYVARIHSHPGYAFHSRIDERNPALCYEGALSVVVPFFGLGLRAGLQSCAVYVRRRRQWVSLPPGLQRDEVIRVVP